MCLLDPNSSFSLWRVILHCKSGNAQTPETIHTISTTLWWLSFLFWSGLADSIQPLQIHRTVKPWHRMSMDSSQDGYEKSMIPVLLLYIYIFIVFAYPPPDHFLQSSGLISKNKEDNKDKVFMCVVWLACWQSHVNFICGMQSNNCCMQTNKFLCTFLKLYILSWRRNKMLWFNIVTILPCC